MLASAWIVLQNMKKKKAFMALFTRRIEITDINESLEGKKSTTFLKTLIFLNIFQRYVSI